MVVDSCMMTPSGAVAANDEESEGVSFCILDNTVVYAKGQDRGSRLPFSIDVTKDPMWIDIGRQQGTFRLENAAVWCICLLGCFTE